MTQDKMCYYTNDSNGLPRHLCPDVCVICNTRCNTYGNLLDHMVYHVASIIKTALPNTGQLVTGILCQTTQDYHVIAYVYYRLSAIYNHICRCGSLTKKWFNVKQVIIVMLVLTFISKCHSYFNMITSTVSIHRCCELIKQGDGNL